jgi:DNA-binding transcriptional ArsR family regulator
MRADADYQSCAARLKALADPDRLQIVTCLLNGHKSVSGIADDLKMPVDKVSHHLGVLRLASIVRTQRQGRFVIYSIVPEVSAESIDAQGTRTIDLGCCQLGLVQPKLPINRAGGSSR